MCACIPDHHLVSRHFPCQQILTVVIGLINEKGAGRTHFGHHLGPQRTVPLHVKRILFDCQDGGGLRFTDGEFRILIDKLRQPGRRLLILGQVVEFTPKDFAIA